MLATEPVTLVVSDEIVDPVLPVLVVPDPPEEPLLALVEPVERLEALKLRLAPDSMDDDALVARGPDVDVL